MKKVKPMEKMVIGSKIRKKAKKGFNPNHKFVANAVEEFLKNGGKIEKIIPDGDNLQEFVNQTRNSIDVDEFLRG